MVDEYQKLNQLWWDERAPVHAASADYGLERFRDPSFVSDVVRFDLPLLGDVSGARGVHLQCHIGTDTVSLSRLGAAMIGLDSSSASLAEARRLAEVTGSDVDFVEADVYDAVTALGSGAFNLVYTGVGALNWLPDIRRWASVVAGLLRPGGRLFIREGHPMLWALADPRDDGLLLVEHPYFERTEGSVWDEGGTYVDTDAVFSHNRTLEWNHGLGDILTAVLTAGMDLTGFVEHDSVAWNALPGMMRQLPHNPNEWQLIDRPWRLPHSYTLQAVKR
jgi:SAM-dependent methyltransferase